MMALLIMVGVVPYAHAGPPVVNLGAAGNYVILAESTITTTGVTHITGDVGLSPAAASFFTGFGQALDSTNQFSTSSLVTGKLYAADYATPTPTNLGTAITNKGTAYTDAAGRPCGFSELTTNLNGQTLATGVYCWTTNALMTGSITLSGSSSDVWIFQIPGTFTVSSAVSVILSGGALAGNVFWQVGGITALGSTSAFQGIILDASDIQMSNGATLVGRALSHTQVTLIGNTITGPGGVIPEFPIGFLVLAIPVLAVYLLMRGKWGSLGARIRPTDG
jgi:hypothetical protein